MWLSQGNDSHTFKTVEVVWWSPPPIFYFKNGTYTPILNEKCLKHCIYEVPEAYPIKRYNSEEVDFIHSSSI